MKRKLLSIFLTLCMMLTLLPTALAEGSVNVAKIGDAEYATLAAAVNAVSTEATTITLLTGVTLTETVEIKDGKKVTIDLNGKTISGSATTTFKVNNGELTVSNGTISVSGEAFRLIGNQTPNGAAQAAKLTVNANVTVTSTSDCCIFFYGNGAEAHVYGSLTSNGVYATIQGNGGVSEEIDNGGTAVTIYPGAKVISTSAMALYIPQRGTVTISGGEITGADVAVEVRSGTLNISGGTFKATAETYSCNPNGNGSTTSGAAIAIAQHNTKQDISVTISGGIFTGVKALSEANPQHNDPAPQVNLEVTGGTFNGDITITDANNVSITNGSFTDIANAVKYAADGATIKLADKATVNCAATSPGTGAIEITKNLIIDGNDKTITAGTGFDLSGGSGSSGKYHMFNITNGANVTIQNLTIDGNKSDSNAVRSGINLYGAGPVNISNVTVKNCSTYGVTVNGSTAVINGLTTSGNTWGGINVDNREDTHTSSLTINSCNLGEEYVVFENDKGGSLTASLTGGTYKGIYVNVGEGITVNVSVTGGTFSTDPSTYVASGYIVMKNGDTFTVMTNSGLTSGTYLSQPNVASGYYAVDNGNGTYTVYKYSSGGSSSSSSSSNTSSSTVKNPDGSTTTTTTNKTTGTTTEVTKNTDGSVDTVTTNKDGSTTETTQTSNGTTATVETNKQGEVTDISASVSASAAREASKSGESVTLPVEGIEPVSASADAPEINVSIPSNSSSVTVEIPVENVTPGTVVVIVNEDGTETIVPTSKVTENGIEVTLTENATIKVVDNSKSFSDVPSDNVFSDEIASMSARGIMVGKEDGSFDVHGSVTLNQIANVAGRVSGAVSTEDYAGGIAWGEANGLATGDAPATRGQVILALYAAAGSPDTMDTGKLSAYSDGAGVPSEMLSAVLWAVEHGILKGTDVGTLDLGANVTRGQAAAFAGRALNAIG